MKRKIKIAGKSYKYVDMLTHTTKTEGFSFKERLAILFGKPLTVVSHLYCDNVVIPIVSIANATVEPLIKLKPNKSKIMSEETQEAAPQNGVAEVPVAEVQNNEGTNAGSGDAPVNDTATDPAEPVAEVPAGDLTEPIVETTASEPEAEQAVVEESWLDRVKMEEKDLTEKVDKLELALEQKKVPADQEHILKMQLNAMKTYQSILKTRIKAAR